MNRSYTYSFAKTAVILLIANIGKVPLAQAVTSPSSLVVKVFEMRVSTQSDCSTWATVFKTASPTSVDLIQNPTLGTGVSVDGLYHCVMFHISNIATVVPVTTDGACTAGTPYSISFFQNNATASITPEGVPIQPSASEVDPWIYFNDSADANSANNCFRPTNVCNCGAPCPLTALSLSSDQTHTLVMNFDNKVDGTSTAQCILDQPVMSIR